MTSARRLICMTGVCVLGMGAACDSSEVENASSTNLHFTRASHDAARQYAARNQVLAEAMLDPEEYLKRARFFEARARADAMQLLGTQGEHVEVGSRGFDGLGLASSGRGEGGISKHGIGLGDVGEREQRGGSLVKKKGRTPKTVSGKPEVMGSLDKEIIRRVVRLHRNEIRYCYEKQLQKDPELAGSITVKFVIARTGAVTSAVVSSSDLKNSAVEQCLTRKIRRWSFPEPKGGGVVIVNYPFKFSS